MSPRLIDNRWLVLGLALLSVFVAIAFAALSTDDAATHALREGGPIEIISACLHFTVAALALWLWTRRGGMVGALAVSELLMGLREIDAHKAFTTHGVFSTKQYFRPDTPGLEKVISAVIVLLVLAAVVGSFWSARRELKALIARRAAAIYGLVTLLGTIVALKEVDGAPRMLARIGLPLSEHVYRFSLSIEEIGEMFLPLLALAVIIQIARAPSGFPAPFVIDETPDDKKAARPV